MTGFQQPVGAGSSPTLRRYRGINTDWTANMDSRGATDRPAQAVAVEAWQLLLDVVNAMDETALLSPTRCAGWNATDLVFHLLVDAQMVLATLASSTDGPADTDFVSYWARSAPGQPSFEHAQFVRRGALAYAHPSGLVHHWRDICLGATRAMARVDSADLVQTPAGHVMTAHDLAVTSAVELTVHYLDLTPAVGLAPQPSDDALRLVRATLDGLLGAPIAAGWNDLDYALKGSGRLPLSDDERTLLGSQAEAFPLLG